MVVGLGNPGARYEHSRHNVGFMAVEEFLRRHGRGEAVEENDALVARARWAGETLLVVRPLSYMNLSGEPVRALVRRHGMGEEEIVLVYDEADLPLGLIRVRPEGRAAGHRGVASILETLGTERVARVRLGIGRPGGEGQLSDFVLDAFEEGEIDTVREMIRQAADALQVLLREGVKAAMNLYNRRSAGPVPD